MDPMWITRETLILDEIERDAWRELTHVVHSNMRSMLAMQMDDSQYNSVSSILKDQLHRIGKQLLPWMKWEISAKDKKAAREEQFKQDRASWEKAFGKIGSMSVQLAEKKARLYLLSLVFISRARKENRQFTRGQQSWLDNTNKAQQGDQVAWASIIDFEKDAITQLFSTTFARRDVLEDIGKELN